MRRVQGIFNIIGQIGFLGPRQGSAIAAVVAAVILIADDPENSRVDPDRTQGLSVQRRPRRLANALRSLPLPEMPGVDGRRKFRCRIRLPGFDEVVLQSSLPSEAELLRLTPAGAVGLVFRMLTPVGIFDRDQKFIQLARKVHLLFRHRTRVIDHHEDIDQALACHLIEFLLDRLTDVTLGESIAQGIAVDLRKGIFARREDVLQGKIRCNCLGRQAEYGSSRSWSSKPESY